MKQISISIIIFSLLSIAYSFTISAYTDEDEYRERYMALDWQELGISNASYKFYALRDEYLSPKYKVQDYGFTFLILGMATFICFRKGKFISAPSSNAKVALVGFGAAALTTGACIVDPFLEFYRGSYPWWVDSDYLGIRLKGVPALAFIFFGWAAVNLIAMNGQFIAGSQISFKRIKGSNYFYLFLLVVTLIIVALYTVVAHFWIVLPGVFWLYFYASLWAGRYTANKLSQQDAASGASA